MGQLHNTVRVDDEIAAELVRIAPFAKCFPILQHRFDMIPHGGWAPGADEGGFQAVSAVGDPFGIYQKGEWRLGFLQPDLHPVGGTKGNGRYVGVEDLDFCAMGHNLCRMVSARQSSQMAQENEQ